MTTQTQTVPAVRAVLSFPRHGHTDYLVVKCPRGHLIQARALDSSFGGSMMQADIATHQGGGETHWDRQAAACCGEAAQGGAL